MASEKIKVEGWEVEADEYIGHDETADYYKLGTEVYKVEKGGSRWFCTLASWPQTKAMLGLNHP